MSINAGLTFEPMTGSETWNDPVWENIKVSPNYPSDQNITDNPISSGDFVIDQVGQVWEVKNSLKAPNEDSFVVDLEYAEGTPQESIVPDIGATSFGCVVTPIEGKLPPLWNATFVSDPVFRKARQFSVSEKEASTQAVQNQETKINTMLGSDDPSSFRNTITSMNNNLDNFMGSDDPSSFKTRIQNLLGSKDFSTLPTDLNNLTKLIQVIYALISEDMTTEAQNFLNSYLPSDYNTLNKIINGIGSGGSGNTNGYVVTVTDWNSGTWSLPEGWSAQKVNSDTALQITHNLGKYPLVWGGLNLETSPMSYIVPTATRNMQVDDSNTCTFVQCAVSNNFQLSVIF